MATDQPTSKPNSDAGQPVSARSHFKMQSLTDLAASLDFSDLDRQVAKACDDLSQATHAAARGSVEPPRPREPSPPSLGSTPPAAASSPGRSPIEQAGEKASRTLPGDLAALFQRVNSLLGPSRAADATFIPREPESLSQAGLTDEEVERLVLKFLLSRGSAAGRRIAEQVCLSFALVEPLLNGLKQEQLLIFKGTATMGDYEYALTDLGRERARRYNEECTYFGAAPVSLREYLNSMAAQSIAKQHAGVEELTKAFKDLIINRDMLDRLGPAINSGRGMFLFGEPGNGKTSIAERVTRCFGSTIWIPRCLGVDGDIIRIFDPSLHETVDEETEEGLFDLSGVDDRWVHIRRPTVIVGGELTMAELEVRQNTATGICEAPVQLKSNCGTLVIDDFGRQRMPVAELLNRWIVPLEKRYDFLNLPSGKKIQVPFDQIIIFSTNLEPRDLVDGAFLRRIPYKIQVPDPTPEEFHQLFERIAPTQGFVYDRATVQGLLERHYFPIKRPLRSCQPRDLLLQVRNYCAYRGLPKVLTDQAFDFAVANYFSVM